MQNKLATAALLLLLAATTAQAKDIEVGLIAPMSGPYARQGQVMKMAADMAIEKVNREGGIKSMGGAQNSSCRCSTSATAWKKPRTPRSAWWPMRPIWSSPPGLI